MGLAWQSLIKLCKFFCLVTYYPHPDHCPNRLYGFRAARQKYSPAECTGAKKTVIYGQPDEKFISTSHVELQNLTIWMHMRRFTRLTNGLSMKMENHGYIIALYFV
jgi:hypothetical protein